MKERGKKFSKTFSYVFLGVMILVLGAVSIYAAVPNPGHAASAIEPPSGCATGEVLSWTGSAWDCVVGGSSPWSSGSGGDLYYNGGDVGIGTSSPNSKLDVVATGPIVGEFVSSSTSGTNILIHNTGSGGRQWNIVSASTGNSIGAGAFGLWDHSANAYRLVVNPSGNVGIGTNAAYSKLSVGSSGNAPYALWVSAGTSTGIYGRGTGTGIYGYSAGSYGGYFIGGATGVASFGGTGYGVYGKSDGGDAFYAGGWGSGDQAYGQASSKRWKNNVVGIDNALDKVLQIEGVYFDWDEGKGNSGHDLGFIAEEIGGVIPEVVSFEDADVEENWYVDSKTGEKKLYASGVDYGALTPVLVEAIKEQQEIIDDLKSELCSKDSSYSWC